MGRHCGGVTPPMRIRGSSGAAGEGSGWWVVACDGDIACQGRRRRSAGVEAAPEGSKKKSREGEIREGPHVY